MSLGPIFEGAYWGSGNTVASWYSRKHLGSRELAGSRVNVKEGLDSHGPTWCLFPKTPLMATRLDEFHDELETWAPGCPLGTWYHRTQQGSQELPGVSGAIKCLDEMRASILRSLLGDLWWKRPVTVGGARNTGVVRHHGELEIGFVVTCWETCNRSC